MFSPKSPRTFLGLLALAAASGLLLSACGSSSSNSSATTSSSGSAAAQTVAVRKVGNVGTVLVDSKGNALYAADQETGAKVLCTGACASVWVPLTLPTGDTTPIAASDLSSKLGVVERPDHVEQVTFDGKPLYRFADDSGPGTVSGNGVSDTFAGRSFTWHVVAPTGATATSNSSSGSTSTGGGYGY